MSSPKYIVTTLAAAGLVSAIGFAYAQSSDERSNDATAITSVEQVQKDQAQINTQMQQQPVADVAATDMSQPQAQTSDTATTTTTTPQDQQLQQQSRPQGTPGTAMPAPADNSNSRTNTAPTPYGATPSTGSPAVTPSSTTDPMPAVAERAPRADRN